MIWCSTEFPVFDGLVIVTSRSRINHPIMKRGLTYHPQLAGVRSCPTDGPFTSAIVSKKKRWGYIRYRGTSTVLLPTARFVFGL